MSFLLDTNVVSELMRSVPDPRVLGWFDRVESSDLHLSVLTLGELRDGVERLAAGERRDRLATWLERTLPDWLEGRLLAVDVAVADRWGRLRAETRRPLPAVDSLLAATALAHGLDLVTRNATDFVFPGLVVVDPWQAEPPRTGDGG